MRTWKNGVKNALLYRYVCSSEERFFKTLIKAAGVSH